MIHVLEMNKEFLLIPLVISVIAVSGCIDTSMPAIGSPIVHASKPYNVSSNIAFLDTQIEVPVDNQRAEDIFVEILRADLIMHNKDGTQANVKGITESTTIRSKAAGLINVSFQGIPINYQIKQNPLRIATTVENYEVIVAYRGTVKIFGFIPYSIEDEYRKTVAVDELPFNSTSLTQSFRI